MKRTTLIALKTLVWLACLWPLAWLVWGAVTNNLGPDPTATITFATGLATLRLLIISLAITPVRRLSPRLGWLIKFRRLLGLFAFFYATLHLLTYVALYAGFDVNTMAADIAKRRFITVGVTAWLLLLAAGRHLDELGHSQAGRQALEPPAQAGLCGRCLRSDSLLVAGEAWRAYAAGDHDCAHNTAACAARAGVDSTQ